MKTHTASLQGHRRIQIGSAERFIPAMAASVHLTLVLLTAVALVTAIVMLSIWAAGSGINHLLGAGTWGAGLIFLALAIDNRKPAARLQVITGLILIVLALFQSFVAPDFIIVSGFVLSLWAAAGLLRQLRG